MGNGKMDAEWDAYRQGIKEKYSPMVDSLISQEEGNVLFDGSEDALRDFYRRWGACEKQIPGCIRTCKEAQDCDYANRTANAIEAARLDASLADYIADHSPKEGGENAK